MSTSLRRRLSRRQTTYNTRTANGSDDEASSRSPSRASTPTQEAVPFDDLSTTPPPSVDGESTIRRVSPSSSAMHRYTLRAPAAVAPQTAPAKDTATRQQARTTAFTEDFSDNDGPEPPSCPTTEPATPIQEKEDPIVVQGEDIQILTHRIDVSPPKRSHSVEVLPNTRSRRVEQLLEPPPLSRKTRSQSRREQRADSGATATETDTDAEPDIGPAKPSKSLRVSKVNQLPQTPSPQEKKAERLAASENNSTTPSKSPEARRKESAKKLVERPPNASDDDDLHRSPDDISPDPLSSSRTRPPSPGHDHADKPKMKSSDKDSIIVNPPRFDPIRLPTYQWISVAGTSSRPDVPWGWPKKWTCCHCKAQTMVEQNMCAKLSCVHARCAGGCKVIRSEHARH